MTEFLAWLIAAPFLLVLLYLALELAFGLKPLSHGAISSDPVGLAILVPAHDEAGGIAPTVAALAAAAPGARIIVVADNCSDATASLAREAGADVIERRDLSKRGKGFALAFGRDYLAAGPPEAVLVLDADCRIAVGSAARLASAAVATGAPVQAANLLVAPPGVSPLVSISNFAMLIKNLVRARGLSRLGGGALLFGTGMAFPWKLFSTMPLATANMVEDLELGIALARTGVAVRLDDIALVTSPAANLANSRGQRSRWEHGFLDTARSQTGPLIYAATKRGSRHLAVLAAHLLVPPLALLMSAASAALVVTAALGALSGNFAPVLLLAGVEALVGLLLLVAWWREARSILPWRDLLRAPLYLLWKIPLYVAFLSRRQSEWNRTERERR